LRTSKSAVQARPGSARHRLTVAFQPVLDLGPQTLLLTAVIIGGIAFVSFWDVFVCLLIVSLGYGLGLASRQGLGLRSVLTCCGTTLLLVVLAYICYLPFYRSYQPPVGGLLPNLLYPTRLSQYLVMFGILLVPIIGLLLWLRYRLRVSPRQILSLWMFTAGVSLLLIVAVAVVAYIRRGSFITQGIQITAENYAYLSGLNLAGWWNLVLGKYLANPWTSFLLITLIALGLGILLRGLVPGSGNVIDSSPRASMDRFITLTVIVAVACASLSNWLTSATIWEPA
jgi:hypothetical protein